MSAVVECEILSTNGRVRLSKEGKTLEVLGYPKMLHLSKDAKLEKEMVVQPKIDGYNVRILTFGGEIVTLIRGGAIDPKTQELILGSFREKLENFFQAHPELVLCVEVTGKKTMGGFKGESDVDFHVFDVFALGDESDSRFLDAAKCRTLCEQFGLKSVDTFGPTREMSFVDETILSFQERLPDKKLAGGLEGAVLKSVDGTERWKYKWEDNPRLFGDKIKPEKERKPEPPESRIVAHFLQGYPEPELGLVGAMSGDEFKAYQKRLEELELACDSREKIGEASAQIVSWLMDSIRKKGDFAPEVIGKIEKQFRQAVGRKVSDFLVKKKKL